MSRKIFMLILSAVLFTNLSAQELSSQDSLLLEARSNLHQAIDKWTEPALQNARAQLERLSAQTGQTFLIHYYIAFADYNLLNFYQSKSNKEMMAKVLEDGIEHLEKSIEINENFAEARGLLSSLLGQKIGLSPLKAVYLGPKSGMKMSRAQKLDPTNPRLHYLAGVSANFTPKLFGGGKDKARRSFKKAAKLFREYKTPSILFPQWGERETYAWLGVIASKSDSLELAESYYKKALGISPDFNWVKYRLQPELHKAMEIKD